MSNDLNLIQIGRKNSTKTKGEDSGNGISRRSFLKILGATGVAAAATGCAKDHEQKIFPRVKSEDGHVPGVPVWYSSTCTECSAGCGIKVRNYDGRSIKVEGSKASPINKGGLCALGQASLQHLYDPDRIRQPLKRGYDAQNKPTFSPVAWEEAMEAIASAVKNKDKKNLFLTGEVSGTLKNLLNEFNTAFSAQHAVYDVMSNSEVAEAAEIVFGNRVIPHFAFDKAETILNFGADFLETWISPVEYANGWAKAKRAASKGEGRPLKFIQVEPRLSLTGANADMWLKNKPTTESYVALAVLREIVTTGANKIQLDSALKEGILSLTDGITPEVAAGKAGIKVDKIIKIVHELKNSEASLILAGGTSAKTSNSLFLQVLCNLLNLVLGNIGNTIKLNIGRETQSSYKKFLEIVEVLNQEKANVLFIYDTNPAFSAPSSSGFSSIARKAEMVVAFASHLDETARLADYILPPHTGLETWGDSNVVPGVYSLIQPTMSPVFDTKAFGDMLIEIADLAGVKFSKAGEKKTFAEYLKLSWKELQSQKRWVSATSGASDFETFWRETLEVGGHFKEYSELAAANSSKAPIFTVDNRIIALKTATADFARKGVEDSNKSLLLYPFFSIKSFDGRAANRPWLQELPDPITMIVWDSWAELNPTTAKKFGVAQGDLITLRNYNGEINVPVYVSEYVHEDIVAVPVGQGHTEYGRFAQQINNGNVFSLLPAFPMNQDAKNEVALFSTAVSVIKAKSKHDLVITSGSPSQLDRGLARTKFIDPVMDRRVLLGDSENHQNSDNSGSHDNNSHDAGNLHAVPVHAASAHGASAHGEGHGEKTVGYAQHDYHRADNSQKEGPKQMYLQREHPLYEWGMSVDLAACTGCSACVVACYAENNIAIVGKDQVSKGREMSWIRIERYFDSEPDEELVVSFLPMMCQHCRNAPCEPVCPVYATYHNEEGLNVMVYNRCVGTRYCSNNCSYKVRRFNWFENNFPEPLNWQLNPDVTKRGMGVMEKCSFCIHRIIDAKDRAKDEGRIVHDGEIQPACVQSCPTQALVFGDLNDANSKVSKLHKDERAYRILDEHINTQPGVSYMEDIKVRI